MDQLTCRYKELVRNSWRIFSLSHRMWNEPMAQAGLSTATFPILETIILSPGISQQEISDVMSLDKSCTSRGCKLLETNGLIRREKSQRVAHGFHCYPTEEGHAVFKDIITKEKAQIHALFESENLEDIARTAAVMERLVERLTKFRP